MQETDDGTSDPWVRYWRSNPVKAWVGESRANAAQLFFALEEKTFKPNFAVIEVDSEVLATLVQELIDYRLASYEARQAATKTSNVIPFVRKQADRIELPYFPDLKIACGHFKNASSEETEHRSLGAAYARLDPARHFIARASGNSMNGGKNPIQDGDYLLLELLSPSKAGSIADVSAELLQAIVHQRYKLHRSIVITSNRVVQDWGKYRSSRFLGLNDECNEFSERSSKWLRTATPPTPAPHSRHTKQPRSAK